MMDQQNTNQATQDQESINIKETLFNYLRYWPYFLMSVIIAMLTAFIFLRYENNIYDSSAKIKILEDNQSLDFSQGGSSTLFDFSAINLENEREIITSRKLISRVIKNSNLQTKVKNEGQFKSSTLYNNEIPVNIKWHHSKDESLGNSPVIFLNLLDPSTYKIKLDKNDIQENHKFGDTVNVSGYSFSIQLKENISEKVFIKEYSFQYLNLNALKSKLSQIIRVEPVGERSDILQISLEGQNKKRSEAIINKVIEEFMQDGVRDNRKIAKRTKNFVQDRLKYLVKELDSVEQSLVQYKQVNEITDINSNAQSLLQKSTQTELNYFNKFKQLSITQLFNNELQNTSIFKLLPVNIGIENSNINSLTDEYNKQILERQKLLVSSTLKNPQVREINLLIQDLKSNILSSVENYILSLKKELSEIDDRINKFERKTSALPKQEISIRKIEREQEIKEELYLFLLEKELEAGLSYAVAAPKVKVVDYAYTNPSPVSPKKTTILAASLLLGLVIPFSIIYIKLLLYTKIYSKSQVERAIKDALIIAEIPFVKAKEERQISMYDNTAIAEAFRIMRTNMSFLKPGKVNKKGEGQMIFITSSTKGEGKTFISANLASVYAANNKKILLVGTDLRNPQLHNSFGLSRDDNGLTNYLSDASVNVDDIINYNVNQSGIDLVLSGTIPPNPSELLDSERFSTFVKEVKNRYDFIILDTSPTIHVSDTLLVSHYSDILLYIIRANYAEYKLTEHINKFKKMNNLDNIVFAINGLSSKGYYSYNYGYGYGYSTDKKKSKFKFWKS
jgi:capsular exopolysaccharide synthesis family protein